MSILIKSELELHYMQEVASIATEVHRQIRNLIAPGVTTAQLERAAADVTVHNGAFPASMGYRYGGGGGGFPGCACFDVNNQVTNCIATDVSLKDGDIVGITVIIRKGNFFAKRHVTYPVGHVSDNVLKLLKTVEEALYCGIAASRSGNHLGDISHAIQQHIEKNGFSVVREYTGHGIGHNLHEDPLTPNITEPPFGLKLGTGPVLRPGMVLCLIPIANMGSWRTKALEDGSVVTEDGSLSAYASHMIAITGSEPMVLTSELKGERQTHNITSEYPDYRVFKRGDKISSRDIRREYARSSFPKRLYSG